MSDEMDQNEVAAVIAALAGALARDMARLQPVEEDVSNDHATATRPDGAILPPCPCCGRERHPEGGDAAEAPGTANEHSGDALCVSCDGDPLLDHREGV